MYTLCLFSLKYIFVRLRIYMLFETMCVYWLHRAHLIDARRRQWHPTPVLLPRKSHGRRSLVGCSSWGSQESDTTEWLPFHFSLSCIGEGNGNPLQCSCLENPRDGGAWWAAVHGVTKVRHNQVTSLSLFTFTHWRRKWQPNPVFLPGESQGRGSLVGCSPWGRTVRHDWNDLAAAAA